MEVKDSILSIMLLKNRRYRYCNNPRRSKTFLKDKYIEESLKILNDDCDGAIIGVKCKDTIKIIDENRIVLETPNRDNLIMVHTPQTFKFEILKRHIKWQRKKIY